MVNEGANRARHNELPPARGKRDEPGGYHYSCYCYDCLGSLLSRQKCRLFSVRRNDHWLEGNARWRQPNFGRLPGLKYLPFQAEN